MNNYEVSIKDSSDQRALSYDSVCSQPILKVFVVCNESDTAPMWGYILGQWVLSVVYRLRKKIEADPSRPVLLQIGQEGYSFKGYIGRSLQLFMRSKLRPIVTNLRLGENPTCDKIGGPLV